MKALRINDYGAPLHLDEVPIPIAGPGQVLVENHFTSLNGVDPGRGRGYLRQVFTLQFPWTPGGDVAGRVAAVGQGVAAFRVGDEVFGYTREAGAYAEFVVVNATTLAHRPAAIAAEEAAGIALVSQTATQMLELAKIKAGQTLLILVRRAEWDRWRCNWHEMPACMSSPRLERARPLYLSNWEQNV
jgi:NADPH:quinone reductase-like Zn-dependent oxidoreductase